MFLQKIPLPALDWNGYTDLDFIPGPTDDPYRPATYPILFRWFSRATIPNWFARA